MATVLASSRYATGLLLRAPDAVAMLGDDAELAPRGPAGAAAGDDGGRPAHEDDAEAAVAAVRSVRRRELLRTAAADLLGMSPTASSRPAEALTSVTAVDDRRPRWTWRSGRSEPSCGGRCRPGSAWSRWAGSAATRCGYGSDADVMFVHDPRARRRNEEAADGPRTRWPTSCAGCSPCPVPDPALAVDAGPAAGRPAGPAGPHAGRLPQPTTGAGPRRGRRRPCCAPSRWPATRSWGPASSGWSTSSATRCGGLDPAAVREIRRIKARMEAERIPRGADPALHLKLGPGGLSDVEWMIQLLQLQHAHAVPALRTTRTHRGAGGGGARRPAARRRRGRADGRLAAGRPGSGTRSCWSAAGPGDTLPTTQPAS